MNILETSRLAIRQLTLADDAFILTLVNTPAWLQFIGDKGVHNLADARAYMLNGPMASYEKLGFGLCGLLQRETLENTDIGFALLPEYIGKGYGFEAASAVLDYARQVLKLNRIVAIAKPGNLPSIQLLTKLGMIVEKTITLPPDGEELLLFTNEHTGDGE